jgi:serine/threonine-protein kinase RsbT
MSHYCIGQTISNEANLKVVLLKAREACEQLGFNSVSTSKITTAISELGHNILKYAGSGQVMVCPWRGKGHRGIEIVACDNGPGIVNIKEAMKDNYSSGGTLGLGLPGVERLMDEFVLTCEPGKGTKVTVRKYL